MNRFHKLTGIVKHSFSIVVLIVTAIIGLNGCTIVDKRYGQQPDSLSHANDYHQVLTQLGAPTSVGHNQKGFMFLYHSLSVSEPQLGIGIPGTKWIKLNWGEAKAHHSLHWYLFTHDGALVLRGEKSWNNALGTGIGMGMIFSVVEAVDQSRFQVQSHQLLWGKQLLEPFDIEEYDDREITEGKRLEIIGQNF
jgi:hypothetical protein